jgi:hypothetical protein
MKRELITIALISIIMGCGKGGSNNPKPNPPAVPDKALLTAPAQNQVCTTGTVISDSLSSITFTWAASGNTDSYELDLKNLLTGVTATQTSGLPQLTITLQRNTPFSWYIVSKSTKTTTTAQSDTWKFYNAGKGTISYAPFPADLTSPAFGQNVTATGGIVNLTWKGSAVVTGTIAGYDIYFGTTSSPAILKSGVTDNFLNNVAVSSKTIYYWKVITKDVLGNTSDSGLYQFSVN